MTRRLISSGSTFEADIGYSRAVVDGEAQADSTLNATVDVVENLGHELLVYLTSNGQGGKTLQARLNPRSQVHTGQTVNLLVETDHVHLFDTDTGQAIF